MNACVCLTSPVRHRLWDIECGACLRVLEGHEELVRCIRFDNKRIVSGAYDGYVGGVPLRVTPLKPVLTQRAVSRNTLVSIQSQSKG